MATVARDMRLKLRRTENRKSRIENIGSNQWKVEKVEPGFDRISFSRLAKCTLYGTDILAPLLLSGINIV